ncbi:MAG: hypothetical protein KDE48_11390 [Anaerolineales bacterium]|nr:hypothetical protein [Anaerolineales bacterium]
MSYMVMFVLDDIDKCSPIFDAWEDAGVQGITILESTGLGRIRRKNGYRDDLPLMPSIRNLLQTREEHHRTIFTLVKTEEMVDKIIDATQAIIGDLNEPNKGVIFVLPVMRIVGIQGWDE